MKPLLVPFARRQHGLITRAQARDAGYRGPELRGLTGVNGAWVVVRRGVYVERAAWVGLSTLDQWKLRDRAALLASRLSVELSHDSAARLHGLPLVLLTSELTHVTRNDVQGCRTEHGVKHHRGPVPSSGRVLLDGLAATGIARTALDVAREHGLPAGLAACDAARRLGARAERPHARARPDGALAGDRRVP